MQHFLETRDQNVNSSFIKTTIEGNNAATATNFRPQFIQKFGYDYFDAPVRCPYPRFLQIVEIARQFYYPDLNPNEGYDRLGYRGTMHFFQSPAGQVIKPLMRVLGPERGAPQFTKNMSNQFPFGVHHTEEVSPGYMRYRVQGVPNPPTLMQGFLRAGLELSGAKNAQFKIDVIFAKDFAIEAFWQ